MKNGKIKCAAAVVILLLAIAIHPQTGGEFEIKQSMIASGGGASSGNLFSVSGTIGQPAAGTVSAGGAFSLSGGFWTFALDSSSTLTISGQVTNNGNPLTGVLIALSGGASGSVFTDAQGFYSFQNLAPGGNYLVMPALTGYSFNPSSTTFNNLSSNQTADFSVSASNCSYSIDPTGAFTEAGGGSAAVSVTTTAGCSWTAVSNDNWITVTSGSSGAGAGTVSYMVAANAGAMRSGSMAIAGHNFIVSQSGSGAGTHSISGVVTYAATPENQAAKFVSGVLMNAAGASSTSNTTNTNGEYLLENLISGGAYTVTPSKSAQVNGISNADATAVAQFVAGLTYLTPNQQAAADVTGNGAVSSLDATYIAQYVASIPNPGQTGIWKFLPVNRSYPDLQTNLTNEDYSAILLGEVTGNWNPAMPESSFASEPDEEGFEQERPRKEIDRQTIKADEPHSVRENNRQTSIKENDTQTGAEGGAGPVTVSAPNPKVVNPAENFVIELTASDTTGRGIFGYEFNFLYDPAVIVLQGTPCDPSGTLSDPGPGRAVLCNPIAPGNLRVVMFSSTAPPLSGAGVLLKLNFTAVGAAGTSSAITFPNFMFNEGIPQAIPVGGQVQILGPTSAQVSVSGRVIEGKAGRPTTTERGVARAQVSFIDSRGEVRTTLTNHFGYYRFENVAAGAAYIFQINAKGRQFAPQLVTVNQSIENLNFFAFP